MKPNTEAIKGAPLKNARELAAMLKALPRDERLRIEGAIIWAGMTERQRVSTVQDSARGEVNRRQCMKRGRQ